jgi:hypothetical protein
MPLDTVLPQPLRRPAMMASRRTSGTAMASWQLEIPFPSTVRYFVVSGVMKLMYCAFAFINHYRGSKMKKLTALIAATLFAGVAFAQAPVAVTTSPQGTVTAPATKGDVKAAAKLEKTEIKANEKIEKAAADAAVTGTKADAKAAKTKASARAKAQKKILAAKKDVAEAQVDASAKVAKDHK